MVKIVHLSGLMPPSFGPVRTWCGRKVPIEQTYHVEKRGRKLCKTCQRKRDRKKRLGLWPWTKTQARISEGVRLAWARRKQEAAKRGR
jgi:hypothetical protein